MVIILYDGAQYIKARQEPWYQHKTFYLRNSNENDVLFHRLRFRSLQPKSEQHCNSTVASMKGLLHILRKTMMMITIQVLLRRPVPQTFVVKSMFPRSSFKVGFDRTTLILWLGRILRWHGWLFLSLFPAGLGQALHCVPCGIWQTPLWDPWSPRDSSTADNTYISICSLLIT